MIIVSDTTTLSNFIQIRQLHLLKALYGQVVIPPIVYEELIQLKKFNILIDELESADWIKVQPTNYTEQVNVLLEHLDLGESEAIALAIELKADYLLIDEVLGREHAQSLQVPVIGSLGVLIEAKNIGLLHSIKPEIDKLISVGFWISKKLYNRILQQANEMK